MSSFSTARAALDPPEARPAPDSELLDQIAAGERPALAALFARHRAHLYDIALEILSDATVAAETVESISRELVHEARHFSPTHYPVRDWLAHATRVAARDRLRQADGIE